MNKTILKFLLILILIFTLYNSCKPPINNVFDYYFEKGIYIVNEGNFTYGNSSLTFLDLKNNTINNNVFQNATSYPLGDVAFSLTIWDNKIYIPVNNSGKIIIIDSKSCKYIGTIKNLSSPRYIEIINSEKAYISDLYSPFITIVNPETFELKGTINVGASTEQMLKYENHVFVTNWNNGNKLFKINTENDQVEDSLELTLEPNSIVIDKNFKLWILCDGGMDADTNVNEIPALYRINPNSMEIEKKIILGNRNQSPTHLQLNSTKDTLYYLNSSWTGDISSGGVFKLSINDSIASKTAFIEEDQRLFYSLFVTSNNEIIVSDAIDYVQPGKILIYSISGNLLTTFEAGIIPGNCAEKF